jgi:hypothetical protein
MECGVLGGQVKRTSVKEGNYTIDLRGIVNAQWSVKQANVGTAVDLIVDTIGVENGEKATLEIYVRDGNYTDHLLETLEAQVSGDQARASWTIQVDEKYLTLCEAKASKKKYSQPFFFFKVKIADMIEQSGLLHVKDWIEVELYGDANKPIPNERFRVVLDSGVVINDKLDGSGKKKVQGVSPGNVSIEFLDRNDV